MRFKDIIGQEAAIAKLQEAIATGRLPHALLFTGPQGVGELALATALAQYMNCLNPLNHDSCGSCTNCLKIQKGVHADVRYIFPIISKKEGGKQLLSQDYYQEFLKSYQSDPYMSQGQWQRTLGGESKQLMISVHEVRELKKSIFLKAFEAKYKVVIFWQVDRVNVQGSNAFLKLLEEPPANTLLLLTSSHPDQLLNTILSRCQRLRLTRIHTTHIQDYLVQRKEIEPAKAEEIAAIAEGSIGNAREMLEESSEILSQKYIEWLRAIYLGNYAKITEQITPICEGSKELQKLFLSLALKKMRDSLCYHLGLNELAYASTAEKAFHEKFSQFVSPSKVERITSLLEEAIKQISGNINAQMTFSALSIQLHNIIRSRY